MPDKLLYLRPRTLHQATSKRLVAVLFKVVALINDAAAQQYALTRIDDILSGKCDLEGGAEATGLKELNRRAKLFQDAEGRVDVPVLMRVLRTEGPDPYCKAAASNSLARLLLASEASDPEPLVAWVCDVLAGGAGERLGGGGSSSGGASEVQAAAIRALCVLLKKESARGLLASHGGVGYLAKVLKRAAAAGGGGKGGGGGGNPQLLYECTFCLWALSFGRDTKPLFVASGAVPALVDQVTAAPREKVVRVSLACLRNLVTVPVPADGSSPDGAEVEAAGAVTTILIGCGLPKSLANMRERSWADPDVGGDVEAVHDALMANYRELSTFDKWASECGSKALKWGSKLVHCEKFWRENHKALERSDFLLLKQLIGLLDALESEVVAVACYDLGEFVRFYPNGKSLAKNLGAKDTVMRLIEHENLEVQREALQCMSKIMVNQWEFVR